MGNTYVENLISTVVNCSDASTWKDAVLEWEIADCEEDSSCSSRCICGKYNHHNGQSDYEFLLKMFNKRDKESISANQDRKIKAIILNSIRPFMQKKFAE